MSFSAEWLALREPADHRARNAEIRNAVAASLAGRAHVSVVDLACGAGSNLRGLAEHLPPLQKWRLVDHDLRLLAAAREALVAWADRTEGGDTLVLSKGDRRIEVVFQRLDLSDDPGAALDGANLVTTAAFFDLVSSEWIKRFCAELAQRELPLYAILTYSGEEVWCPPHSADEAMLKAFHRHQARDKGFGHAAGPQAASILKSALEAHGYVVAAGKSPWSLRRLDAELIKALADGAASAIAQTGLLPPVTVEKWRESRVAATACEIGHVDLFAVPVDQPN